MYQHFIPTSHNIKPLWFSLKQEYQKAISSEYHNCNDRWNKLCVQKHLPYHKNLITYSMIFTTSIWHQMNYIRRAVVVTSKNVHDLSATRWITINNHKHVYIYWHTCKCLLATERAVPANSSDFISALSWSSCLLTFSFTTFECIDLFPINNLRDSNCSRISSSSFNRFNVSASTCPTIWPHQLIIN